MTRPLTIVARRTAAAILMLAMCLFSAPASAAPVSPAHPPQLQRLDSGLLAVRPAAADAVWAALQSGSSDDLPGPDPDAFVQVSRPGVSIGQAGAGGPRRAMAATGDASFHSYHARAPPLI